MKIKKYTKLGVAGSIAFDEIMDFPGLFKDFFQPDKLHQINVSFAVTRLEKQIGGTGANIAYNASLFLKDKVKLFSAVGRDGDIFIDWLKKNNINETGILKDNNLFTASGKVITDRGDNQIWGYYYGALEKARHINLKKYLDDKTLFIISATEKSAFLNFQAQLISSGVDYIYDPGMALTWISPQELKKGMLRAQIIIGNDYEVSQMYKMTGLTNKDLKRQGLSIITTQGSHGVLFEHNNHFLEVPAFNVRTIVDPTGAGDAWRGGFAAGLLTGDSLEMSLVKGNALSSFAIEKYGTVNHRPTISEMERRMHEIKKKMKY